jgi:hypothetical protein
MLASSTSLVRKDYITSSPEIANVLTTATVDRTISGAAAVHADTCSFTLSALSPNQNLWDAIPRDIDTVRYASYTEIDEYCRQLAADAEHFSHQIRHLLHQHKLVAIDPIKQEVKGQKGRTNGLALRAAQRFPFAPSDLVQKSLAFQMAVHDHALAAQKPKTERHVLDQLMKRLHTFWREQDARFGKHQVSFADKLLFATAASNAVMIENGSEAYGDVVLVSRDFNHVFKMYHYREDLLRPVCKKLKLLYPRNFLFKPTFQSVPGQ